MMKKKFIRGVTEARDLTIEGMYSCEILFDGWEHIDNILHDKDVYVVYCNEVFPGGPRDRRHRSEELPLKDDMSYHSPVVRLIFQTSSKTLYDNTYRTLGIDYHQKYWYIFTYKDFMDAKKKDINRSSWLRRFKRNLSDNIKKSNRLELIDVVNDKLWWKGRRDSFRFEDDLNGIFGVKLNPINDSSARNMSKFKNI